jgi:hypothetical protein
MDIFDAITELGSVNRGELLVALIERRHREGNNLVPTLQYCRTELRDMWNRGHLEISDIGSGRMPARTGRN